MKKANIVILAGQSNAVGVGHSEYLPRHFDAAKVQEYYNGYENVPINYRSHGKVSGGFVKTEIGCTEPEKTTIGPELSMAEAFTQRGDENVFIVKCAFGATNLYEEWLSPSGKVLDTYEPSREHFIHGGARTGWCYAELVEILGESIKLLTEQGYEPHIRAFCWMQGESDAFNISLVDGYMARYEAMIGDLRAKFAPYFDADCRYIDAGINATFTLWRELNEKKAEYARGRENYFFIDTIAEGLTTCHEPEGEVDPYHYDSDSVIKLGKLFAQYTKI